MKDTPFFNRESGRYSERRYPRVARTYTQFFYKRRLILSRAFLEQIIAEATNPLALLEVGCADGVIIRAIEEAFPDVFRELVGIDIAPAMIEEAIRRNTNPRASFVLRSEYHSMPMDLIVETGVANYSRIEDECLFAHHNLKQGGQFILSIAGTGSLYNRLKRDTGFNDFRSYKESEDIIRRHFSIRAVRGCGLLIPFIWRIPPFARMIQAIVEPLASVLAPDMCHEKLYLLEKK